MQYIIFLHHFLNNIKNLCNNATLVLAFIPSNTVFILKFNIYILKKKKNT